MTTNRKPKGTARSESRGKLPAWIWRAIRDSERNAGDDHFAVTILRDSGASFVLVELNDWNEILYQERADAQETPQ
jgi:hypothetical protein